MLGAPWADTLLVSARTSGAQRDEKGVTVFVVDKKSRGISPLPPRDLPRRATSLLGFLTSAVRAHHAVGDPPRLLAAFSPPLFSQAFGANPERSCRAL